MKLDTIKNIRKKIFIEKYGADHHMKSINFINKFKENNIKLFGVDNVSKLESVKAKKKGNIPKKLWNK